MKDWSSDWRILYNICLWGIYWSKEKFGSMFTSWCNHLYTGSSSIRHECGDGHQKSNLQIHLQRTEKTSWIFAEKTIFAARDRITEEDSTWTLLVWILRREHHQKCVL
jgi:hypothetical protein